MAAYIKFDGIAAQNTQVLSSPRNTGRDRNVDVGDRPDGVSGLDQSMGGDRLDLSLRATDIQSDTSADRVSITSQPTPSRDSLDSANEGIDERV